MSCTHGWNGTVLSVTSVSGTSSADLVGPPRPAGASGPQSPTGVDGTSFTPQSPLSLGNGVLSVDLSSLRTCDFKADLAVAVASMDSWFYSNTTLTGVTGWANVRWLQSLRFCFDSRTGLALLDLCGPDPSSLKDLFYVFGGCTSLAIILADSTWALLSSGVSGMNTFYNCTKLVGGNGTAYPSSAAGYARMVIDRAGHAGYLTN